MKKIILSVAVIALALGVNAQKGSSEDAQPLKFSVGIEAALPLGDFGKISSFGIGGTAQADYNVASDLDITLNAGFISFAGKSVNIAGFGSVKYPTVSYIPVLGGIKYHFTENVYGSAQLGLTFASASGAGSSSAFTYAPGVGYKFTENIDALLKYTGYSADGGSTSTIGLRVAYTF
jgi:Outer membrane protein beta-barrel domain